MNQVDNITALVLAGGTGSRVGGQDKGLLLWQGTPLVSHVITRLQKQTPRIIISCNRNFDEYSSFGFPTVGDNRADFQGPLAGIEAARTYVKTDYLAVVACDTPALPSDLLARLLTPLLTETDSQPLISFAHDGRREQYLFSVLNMRCLDELPDFLEQGHRAVKHWYRQTPHVIVDFSDQRDAFRNYNYLRKSESD